MNFEWAIKQLDQGKSVRRTAWWEEIFIFKDVTDFGRIKINNILNEKKEAHFKIADFLMEDWEIYLKCCSKCGRPL